MGWFILLNLIFITTDFRHFLGNIPPAKLNISKSSFITAEQPGDSQGDANKSKRKFFFLSRRFMRTGGRTSQITFLQAGRTAQWPSLMRKASGTTCPATTTCPTSARKEQVNGKCPQWRSLLAVANAFSSPSTAQKSAENCRSLRAISISLFSTCCLLPRPDKHSHPYCHQKLWSQFFPMTSLFRQNIPWCPPELR